MKHPRKPDPLLVRVIAALTAKADDIPEGFRTIDQWAKHWGLGRSSASRYVHKAVEMGLMEKKSFTQCVRKDGRAYPTAHYREIVKPRQRGT